MNGGIVGRRRGKGNLKKESNGLVSFYFLFFFRRKMEKKKKKRREEQIECNFFFVFSFVV